MSGHAEGRHGTHGKTAVSWPVDHYACGMPAASPASGPLISRARWLTVLGVGVITAALSALPAAYLGYVAASSATGCFGQCGEPDGGLAAKAGLLAMLMLSGPVALMTVLMPRGQRLRWIPAFVVLAVVVMVLFTWVWTRGAVT